MAHIKKSHTGTALISKVSVEPCTICYDPKNNLQCLIHALAVYLALITMDRT